MKYEFYLQEHRHHSIITSQFITIQETCQISKIGFILRVIITILLCLRSQ